MHTIFRSRSQSRSPRVLPLGVALGAVLLLAACGDDAAGPSPDPDPDPSGDAVTFSGPGAAHLPDVNFHDDVSYEDGVGNWIWVDQPGVRAAGDVTIQVFPSPVDPAAATSVSLFHEGAIGSAWTVIDPAGVPGVTIDGSGVTFRDVVVVDAFTSLPDVTINGTLTVPVDGLLPPAAPAGLGVTAQDGNLEITWNDVAGADSYTVYVARDDALTPLNWAGLTGGARYADASRPFTFPGGLTNGLEHWIVVTASNAAGESEASATASGTPAGAPAGLGSLTLSGDGATLLPSTSFAPDAAGPGGAVPGETAHFWFDHANTAGQLYVLVDGSDPAKVFSVRFVQGDRTWQEADFGGVSSVARVGDAFTFTATALGETGGGTTLTLDGAVNATLVAMPAPTGSLALSGTGTAETPSTTFTPTSARVEFGALYLEDGTGMELEFSLVSGAYNSTNRVTLRAGGTVVFQKQNTLDPVPGFSMSGTGAVFTDVTLPRAFGSTELVLNGTVAF